MNATRPDRSAALLESVRRKRADVGARFSPNRLNGCRPQDVRRVLVIASASRSGSSFLHHLLARHPDVVSLNGEGSVFARLHDVGLARAAQDSDFIAPGDAAAERAAPAIAEDALRDAGVLARHAPEDGALRENFVADGVQRLLLQFPETDADPDALRGACARALGGRSPREPGFSVADYWRAVLDIVGRGVLPARPGHYDLRGSDPAADFPDRGNLAPPPFSEFCLEEPPFVVPQPRALPAPGVLAGKTLLLKSSSDCYRLWLLPRLFPNARFRHVVLTRNPAGAISGLVDGWLSDGFYSQNVGRVEPLDLKGYSRADRPWTTQWWNFDLPPGWSEDRAKPVEEACARQWLSANEHVQAAVKSGLIHERLTARYESFLEPASLARELGRIFEFAGLAAAPAAAAAPSLPVMSVTPPAPQKWRKRRDALAGLVAGGRVAAMARELGYDPARWEEWP